MQFELNHKVTENTVKVTFSNYNGIHKDSLKSMFSTFNKLGANQCDTASFLFPSFITSQVIKEIINNTCFICGGLMQSQEYHSDHILRKCQSCGHSHT